MNFKNFQSIHSFLKHIQQDIATSPFSRIARKYSKINHLEKHFKYDQFHFQNPSEEKKIRTEPNQNYIRFGELLKDLKYKKKKNNLYFNF